MRCSAFSGPRPDGMVADNSTAQGSGRFGVMS
jgi:hypothetical protein